MISQVEAGELDCESFLPFFSLIFFFLRTFLFRVFLRSIDYFLFSSAECSAFYLEVLF